MLLVGMLLVLALPAAAQVAVAGRIPDQPKPAKPDPTPRIADGHPDNAFVHLMLRVGHGRDLDTRKRACDAIFATACEQLASLYDRIPLGISLEMQEVDAVLTCKKNNLHEYVKERLQSAGPAKGSPS